MAAYERRTHSSTNQVGYIIVIGCRHGIYYQNDPSPSGLRPRARAVSDDKYLAHAKVDV